MRKALLLSGALLLLPLSLFSQAGPGDIIPLPVSYEEYGGSVAISDGTAVRVVPGDDAFRRKTVSLPPFACEEAYRLDITSDGITIMADTEEGVFRARTTLRNLSGISDDVKCCTIFDYPRYSHRGVMFDISRNFRDKDFIIKQIDALSLVKMNTLHLHLCDDAGWRVEIDSYPLLCSRAAWRIGNTWTQWKTSGELYANQGDKGASGGFLSKDDVREIVSYARSRPIDVIPEIEMPGHSAEVLEAYPSLACIDSLSGESLFSSDVCIGNEETFEFFQRVLDEVIEMFPSRYIHIGGDEASKESWKRCSRCQKRMEEEGLSSVDELQSYMIRRMEKYLSSRGRTLLGWDEIMQGGLARGATVMSWRGTGHGQEAILQGHDVVMSPNTYCYLDYYQDAPMYCPRAIGGYIPLEKTYSYDPSEGISDESHLLGLQGNLWCEYISSSEQFEYMLYPRAFAIAEIGWSPQGKRDFTGFRHRALALSGRIREIGYNPFDLSREFGQRPESKVEVNHVARGCNVTYNIPYSRKYPSSGDGALTDGRQGGWSYSDDAWQGFSSDLDVVVDLGSRKDIHYVGAWFLTNINNWVAYPETFRVLVSDDGEDFREVALVRREIDDDILQGNNYALYGAPVSVSARYVRVQAARGGKPRHEFLFTDEIVVN